MTAMLNKTI